MTNHLLSICPRPGNNCREACLATWDSILAHYEEWASEDKHGCHMVFQGYSAQARETPRATYPRLEKETTHMDLVLLDVDNEEGDPRLLEKFEALFLDPNHPLHHVEHWWWETASSTPHRPKFRVVLPLARTLPFSRWAKRLGQRLFPSADPKASWFYLPVKGVKMHHVPGHELDAEAIVEQMRLAEQASLTQAFRHRVALSHLPHHSHSVAKNPKVRHYLDTPFPKLSGNGDSERSLYVALLVCLVADDLETLEQVKAKAASEHWT